MTMTTTQDAEHILATQQHRSRMRDDDPTYLRLRDATQRRLSASLQRLVRELRGAHQTEQHTALSDFISRQTSILQDAYIAAHQAGASDYFGEVSQTPGAWAKRSAVDPDKMRRALSFYAPSIAKMAHEALAAVNAAPGVKLEEVIEESVKLGFFSGFSRVTSGMRGALGGVGEDANHTLYSAHGHHFAGRAKGEHNEANIHEHLAAQHHGEGEGGGGIGRRLGQLFGGGRQAPAGDVGRLGHGAQVQFLHGSESQARENFHSLFGRNLADHEIASLVGARPGDAVRITGASGGRDRVAMVHLTLVGENGAYTAYRSIFRNVDGDSYQYGPRGRAVMNNNEFHVGNTGHGVGAEVFGRQVMALSRLGVSQINTRAEGRGNINIPRQGHIHGEMVGYYVWPRLGYNGKISDISGAATSHMIKEAPEFRSAQTVRDIMRMPHVDLPHDMQFRDAEGNLVTHLSGREWWRRFGTGFGAHFDLKPGSESMNILNAYLAERGIVIDMSERHDNIRLDDTTTGHEEIEWTDEDEAAADRAWQRLYPDLAETENDDATRIE